MSNNSVINLGDLAKPADTLVARFCDGIGGIFRPIQIKRVAKAETAAETIRMRGEIDRIALVTSAAQSGDELTRRAIGRMVEQEIRHQTNMEEILGIAIANISADAKPEALENDFVSAVFDKCKNVSDEDLRHLWGNIIAREANVPKSICRKTLDVVATLERSDAELFSKLGSFCFDFGGSKPFLTKAIEPILASHGLHFRELIHLSDLGLIQHNPVGFSQWRTLEDQCPELTLSGKEGHVVVRKNEPGTLAVDYGQARLTRVGKELLNSIECEILPGVFDAVIYDLMGLDRTVFSPLG
jgi:hypothetical protein